MFLAIIAAFTLSAGAASTVVVSSNQEVNTQQHINEAPSSFILPSEKD